MIINMDITQIVVISMIVGYAFFRIIEFAVTKFAKGRKHDE